MVCYLCKPLLHCQLRSLLGPGCCSLVYILSAPQGAGKHWVLVPSFAAHWVGYSVLETA